MNHPKILRKSMNLKQVTFILALGLLVCVSGASAQEKLGELVSEGGFDWMIGDWIATTDSGDKVELVWKWELDEHMLSVHLKWPNYEYRGMIYYIPAEEKVVQIGVDNKGGSGKGLWEANGSKAVNKYEHTDINGQVRKMGMVHSQTGNDAMKVDIYEISDTGQLGESPTFTTEYKRQKKQTPPKAQSKAAEDAKSIAEQGTERMKIAEFQVVR